MATTNVGCCITALLLLFYRFSCSILSLENTDLIYSKSESSLISNEYEGDNDTYWRSISHFIPIQDGIYGTISIKSAFYMKFDLVWHGLSDIPNRRPYEGVFRIGTPSTDVADCTGHATRYPALYLDRNLKALQFSISDHIDCWGVGLLNVSYTLHIDTVYTITIQYNESWVMVQINDNVLYNDKRPGTTPDHMIYNTAYVMISDSLDPPANVTLSNIMIVSYDDILTMPPTLSPTQVPTVFVSTLQDIIDTTVAGQETLETDTTETTETTENIGDPDTFFVEVIINAVYLETDEKHNDTLNETVIEVIIMDTFPSNMTNITQIYVDIDTNDQDITVEAHTPIDTKQEVDILIAYLQYNLTTDLVMNINKEYEWCVIVDVTYEVTVREIYIRNNKDNTNVDVHIRLFPFDTNIATYIMIAVVSLCLCSFILCICILCRYYKLSQQIQCIEKENKMNRTSTLCITQEKMGIDIQNTDKIAQEFKRLSQSLSGHGLQISGSVEEVSLGTHVMRSPEGDKTHHSLYHRVLTNLPPMDDDDSDASSNANACTLLDELTTDNFSVKVNMNVTPSRHKHVAVPSHSEYSAYSTNDDIEKRNTGNKKLSMMIEDQIRITNQYGNCEDMEDSPSMTHSSHEAMYDEGFNGLIDIVHDTTSPHTTTSPTNS